VLKICQDKPHGKGSALTIIDSGLDYGGRTGQFQSIVGNVVHQGAWMK
jgi:hypothetical protein